MRDHATYLRTLAEAANEAALEVGRLLVALDEARAAYSAAAAKYANALVACEAKPEDMDRVAAAHRALCIGCPLCSPEAAPEMGWMPARP